MDKKNIGDEIKKWRNRYGLSLAQFGKLVNVPAISIKRWEEGVRPAERYVYQIMLIVNLWANPDMVLKELKRSGLEIDEGKWNHFINLLSGVLHEDVSVNPTADSNFISSTIVYGTTGILSVIAEGFFSNKTLWKKFIMPLGLEIGRFLS